MSNIDPHPTRPRANTANGKWVVIVLVTLGLIGGTVGLFVHPRAPSLRNPTTTPATTQASPTSAGVSSP